MFFVQIKETFISVTSFNVRQLLFQRKEKEKEIKRNKRKLILLF